MENNARFIVANRSAIATISWLLCAMSSAEKGGIAFELYVEDGSEGAISKASAGAVSCNSAVNEGRSVTGVDGDVGGVWKGATLDCRSAEIDLFLFSKLADKGEDPAACGMGWSRSGGALDFCLFFLPMRYITRRCFTDEDVNAVPKTLKASREHRKCMVTTMGCYLY